MSWNKYYRKIGLKDNKDCFKKREKNDRIYFILVNII